MDILRVVASAFLVGFVATAWGGSVYRSVGPDGEVTFSDTPPAGVASAEKVDLLAPLSEERRKEAEARHQKLIDLAAQGAGEGEEKEAARKEKLAAARKAVDDARTGLEQAKAVRVSDWWGNVGSGQLKPGYEERVRKAEETLQTADREYRLLRSGQKE